MWIKTKLAFGILLISMVSMWVFEGTTANLFVWDSHHYLFRYEDHIAQLSLDNLCWMLTSLEFYNWHPLTWLSWAIDYQIYGGLDPRGYHLTNNVLHSVNSTLVFILILIVFGLNKSDSETLSICADNRSIFAALGASLIFAVHPQHVESVAWVAERKDLLCQLFVLLSVLAYVKYVTCQHSKKLTWFLITLSLFTLALASKPMAVTLPVLLLLVDIYPLRRTKFSQPLSNSIQQHKFSYLIAEKIPFFVLSALVVAITISAQQGALDTVSFDLRALNAFNSILLYLEKLIVPLHFSPHYPYFPSPAESLSFRAFIPLVGFVAISALTLIVWFKGHRAWLVGWLIYLVALSPVLGLIQVGSQGAADRYAYLPTLPVYVFIGGGILMALNRNIITRFSVLLATFSLIIFLIFITREQVHVWKNNLTLWNQAVASYPDSVFVRNNLAITHLNQGNYEIAAYHFEKSEQLSPGATRNLAWRALTYLNLGRYSDALNDHINLGIASEKTPDLIVDQNCIQYNIGWLYAHLDLMDEAIELMRRVDPTSNLGMDATIWANSLENSSQMGDGKFDTEGLPGFCIALIPSRVWINGALQ